MMNNFIHLCPNCFADKQTAQQCPSCGYEETSAQQNPLYIKPLTILKQRYLIGNVIGHGGFGITYVGWDTLLERKVAIKEFLPTTLATRVSEINDGNTKCTVMPAGNQEEAFKTGLKKFKKEAKILAELTHENIVRVIDYLEAYNTGYIVMEYVGQEDLSQLLKRQPEKRLSVTEALEIFLPILQALKVIHAAGIYHQDISLQNIRMVDGKKPVLIDFGAARYIVGELSRSLDRIFKPGYSPVEQITNDSKKIGPWTDVYASGAVFYAMIVGELPPPSVDRLDRDDLIAPTQKKGVEISPSLNDAVLKALSVRIGDRFQTVDGFEKALLNSGGQILSATKKLLLATVGVFFTIAIVVVVTINYNGKKEHIAPEPIIPTVGDSEQSSFVTNGNVSPTETENFVDDDNNRETEIQSQPDRQSPDVEIKINSVYQIGDTISYSIFLKDDKGLEEFTFKLNYTGINETKKLYGKKVDEYNGSFSTASTDDWQTGRYTYLLTVKDKAGNTTTKEGNFLLKPATVMLTLRSNVYGDEVYIDGVFKGSTRLDLELSPGQHEIKILKNGYTSYEEVVYLKEDVTIKAKLRKIR